MDRDRVIAKLNDQQYYEFRDDFTLHCNTDRMNMLHFSLEKMTYVNKARKGKPNISCLSGGKVDKQV